MEKQEKLSLIEEAIEVPAGTLTGTEELAALDWDSLMVLGFLALADERLGMSLSPEQVNKCNTVDDLILMLDKPIKE